MIWEDILKNNTDFGVGVLGKTQALERATTELHRLVSSGKGDYTAKIQEVTDRAKDLKAYIQRSKEE